MGQHVIDQPPTSTAATAQTEPEVVAGISSAEGGPDIPTNIRVGGSAGTGVLLLALAAGLAIGFGATRFLRDRG